MTKGRTGKTHLDAERCRTEQELVPIKVQLDFIASMSVTDEERRILVAALQFVIDGFTRQHKLSHWSAAARQQTQAA